MAGVTAETRVAKVPLLPIETGHPKSTVLVTGCTGYIAGPTIERLLRAGHTVHATCRDPDNNVLLARLAELPGPEQRLKFFKADLTQAGSFDAAMQGCDYVIHMAAPVTLTKVKPGEGKSKLIDPMLAGVDNVLDAVNRTPSVKRVVMTSSISAICTTAADKPKPADGSPLLYTEADWNTTATETFLPYARGKTLSEKRAWELAGQQSRWDLVTVCPSVVMGPTVLKCDSSESIGAVRDILWPGLMWPAAGDIGVPLVDVRDVAALHCLAMVTPGAKGRYIAHAKSTNFFDVTHVVASVFPKFWPSKMLAPYWLVWLIGPLVGMGRDIVRALWGPAADFDTRRTLADLGLPGWVPEVDTWRDMIQDMLEKGQIKKK
ncbi:hypothetical protein HYH02_005026 [Chlamydomonas schloesseri]|uniref:NAD-dependent epimerase/dehydratase domain-containing protein n=1 Tax=Chlamydomonas schloesseri TaxID=2026947 RepID=A0A835WPU9_9CHLO|nr:hypothetical protein HYH02_005026 [Chlamydomonas schloesseri]|eukprot:KAG2450525.1 hypothetical protein HYH02_005026 [Chlamydomonas schloesseri]